MGEKSKGHVTKQNKKIEILYKSAHAYIKTRADTEYELFLRAGKLLPGNLKLVGVTTNLNAQQFFISKIIFLSTVCPKKVASG